MDVLHIPCSLRVEICAPHLVLAIPSGEKAINKKNNLRIIQGCLEPRIRAWIIWINIKLNKGLIECRRFYNFGMCSLTDGYMLNRWHSWLRHVTQVCAAVLGSTDESLSDR